MSLIHSRVHDGSANEEIFPAACIVLISPNFVSLNVSTVFAESNKFVQGLQGLF